MANSKRWIEAEIRINLSINEIEDLMVSHRVDQEVTFELAAELTELKCALKEIITKPREIETKAYSDGDLALDVTTEESNEQIY